MSNMPPGARWEPHNGRCVCEIHRQFEAANGYTVDEYYEMHPDREPWYLERCPNCPERSQQTPAPLTQPEPVAVGQRHPEIVFVENPKQVLQESITDMCNTFVNQNARDGCATCPAAPAISAQSAMAGLLVLGALIFLPLTILFGFYLVLVSPFILALWWIWKQRYVVFAAYLALDAYLTRLFVAMAVSVWQTVKPKRPARPNVILLPAPDQPPAAPKLLGMAASDPIEMAVKARPIPVKRSAKYGNAQ